jgi:WD40 repeat protein
MNFEDVQILNFKSGKILTKLSGPGATSGAIFSERTKIVIGDSLGEIRVWDVKVLEAMHTPASGHIGSMTSVVISQDDRSVLSISEDETVKIWDAHCGI